MGGTKCSPCVQESRIILNMMVELCAETTKYRGLIRSVQRETLYVLLCEFCDEYVQELGYVNDVFIK